MKEKIKKNWKLILLFLSIIFFIILYFLFVFDIGLNSEHFVRRDFNGAFLARETGNCSLFKEYVSEQYKEEWNEKCMNEKDKSISPIRNFSIKNITIANEKAFLQVEIERELNIIARAEIEKELGREFEAIFNFNYDMEKTNSDKFLYIIPKTRWIIMNEIMTKMR
ncbi:MAG: hypothetical protein WBC21_01095 [Minisyncoccales bacterium]